MISHYPKPKTATEGELREILFNDSAVLHRYRTSFPWTTDIKSLLVVNKASFRLKIPFTHKFCSQKFQTLALDYIDTSSVNYLNEPIQQLKNGLTQIEKQTQNKLIFMVCMAILVSLLSLGTLVFCIVRLFQPHPHHANSEERHVYHFYFVGLLAPFIFIPAAWRIFQSRKEKLLTKWLPSQLEKLVNNCYQSFNMNGIDLEKENEANRLNLSSSLPRLLVSEYWPKRESLQL